jgi:hypothetical protein
MGTQVEISCYIHNQASTIPTKSHGDFKVSKPNKSIWHYWHKFLTTLTTHKSRRLRAPLGEWIAPISQVRRQYNTYCTEKEIFTKKGQEIIQQHLDNNKTTKSSHIPEEAIPCM